MSAAVGRRYLTSSITLMLETASPFAIFKVVFIDRVPVVVAWCHRSHAFKRFSNQIRFGCLFACSSRMFVGRPCSTVMIPSLYCTGTRWSFGAILLYFLWYLCSRLSLPHGSYRPAFKSWLCNIFSIIFDRRLVKMSHPQLYGEGRFLNSTSPNVSLIGLLTKIWSTTSSWLSVFNTLFWLLWMTEAVKASSI